LTLDAHEALSMREQQEDTVKEHIAAALDEVIEDLLGKPVIEALHAYLLERGVSRTNLATKVQILCSALDAAFGDTSPAIQRTIARRLYAKLNLNFVPIEGAGLVEYLRKASRIKV